MSEPETFEEALDQKLAECRRVMIAKATDIVDAWLVLEGIRARAVSVWADRDRITPCLEPRSKAPALEIWKRLPRTNCGECGESTCLAFSVRVWMGEIGLQGCRPVFEGPLGYLREDLIATAAGRDGTGRARARSGRGGSGATSQASRRGLPRRRCRESRRSMV